MNIRLCKIESFQFQNYSVIWKEDFLDFFCFVTLSVTSTIKSYLPGLTMDISKPIFSRVVLELDS